MCVVTPRFVRRLLAIVVVLLSSASVGRADTLTLAWDPNPEPDVAGYYVFIGTASGIYDTVVDVANSTAYTFGSAQPGRTYYMTVAAYVAGPILGPHAPEVVATVTNTAPVLINPGNLAGQVGNSVSLAVSASDPDGDPITFGATGLPPGLALQTSTGLITGTLSTAGVATTTLSATDPFGNVATQVFTWTVVAVDITPPSIVISSPSTSSVATTSDFVTLSGVASDDFGVTSVTWAANGNSGVAAGTTNWSVVVGIPTGTSMITVTAHDAAGHTTSGAITVTRSAPTAALSVTSLTADKPAPQIVGTSITFAASTTGGIGPIQYKWRVFNGSSWSVLQGWSTSSTFIWKPSKANAAYTVEVWARSSNSTADAPDSSGAVKNMAFPISDTTRLKRRR